MTLARNLFHGNMLALQIRVLMIVAACMSLAGCPRGHDERQPPTVQTQPPAQPSTPADDSQAPMTAERRRQILATKEIGFFYCDWDQLAETAGWVTFTHIAQCDQYGLNLIAHAIELGHQRLIVTVDSFGFIANGNRRTYRGQDVARDDLRRFFSALIAMEALGKVIGIYTCDEPNLDEARIVEDELRMFCADVRTVCAEFGIAPLLWTAYSGNNGDRPAIDAHDCVGVDDYGKGIDVLGDTYRDLKSRMHPAGFQKLFYVPGCARSFDGSRWEQEPQAWVDAAIADDDCIGIMAFDWCGYGHSNGLRDESAELRQAWINAGYEIVTAHNQENA